MGDDETTLESYFDFLGPLDIRIKGHRIGIEAILHYYTNSGENPEEIQQLFPTLTLEQVYATILYYWRYQKRVEKYLWDWNKMTQERRAEERTRPPTE